MQMSSIIDIHGIKVGHAENSAATTGCTVILCEKGAVGGVSQRGGAPGTRETDLLRPMHAIQKVHGILLSGGSAFGLDAAGGVMQYLEEKGIGFNAGPTVVPIVPTAILFDLDFGDHHLRPNKPMGYQACQNANSNNLLQGNVGAGCGATVGKILGRKQAMKAGLGSACIAIGNNIKVGAIFAVNAFGDVIENNRIIAGVRTLKKGPITIGSKEYFADTRQVMQSFAGRQILSFASRQNTVIGIVATNAALTKEEINYVADVASNGISSVIRPSFTMFDGDTIFSISTGRMKADVNLIAAYAPDVVSQAILKGTKAAKTAGDLPGYADLHLKE